MPCREGFLVINMIVWLFAVITMLIVGVVERSIPLSHFSAALVGWVPMIVADNLAREFVKQKNLHRKQFREFQYDKSIWAYANYNDPKGVWRATTRMKWRVEVFENGFIEYESTS